LHPIFSFVAREDGLEIKTLLPKKLDNWSCIAPVEQNEALDLNPSFSKTRQKAFNP
jgi:hypothetical protein